MADLGNGRGWLNDGPAASIKRIDKQLGHPLQITEAGRNWDEQNAHYQTYLRDGSPIALSPDGPPKGNGPSIHQLGAAIDSDEAQRILPIMAAHGWVRTVYRNGVLVEPWHFEYRPDSDQYRNQSTTTTTLTLSLEDEMNFFNLLGKTGSHHMGTFAVYRSNSNHNLYAKRITTAKFAKGDIPTFEADALDELKAIFGKNLLGL